MIEPLSSKFNIKRAYELETLVFQNIKSLQELFLFREMMDLYYNIFAIQVSRPEYLQDILQGKYNVVNKNINEKTPYVCAPFLSPHSHIKLIFFIMPNHPTAEQTVEFMTNKLNKYIKIKTFL